jgi:hypothetical protein
VYIILNKKSSFDFDKAYTKKDFAELTDYNYEVIDMTELVSQQVKKQLAKNYDELQRETACGMLVEVDKFRRILYIELKEPSTGLNNSHISLDEREIVFNVIKILEKRKDAIYVSAYPDINDRIVSDLYDPKYKGYTSVSGSFKSLSVERERQIRQAYAEYIIRKFELPNDMESINQRVDGLSIVRYIGTYNGYAVAAMVTATFQGDPTYLYIDGIEFFFFFLNPIMLGAISDEGEFSWLLNRSLYDGPDEPSVYDLGLVTIEDIRNMAYFWNGGVELN